jgi:hypothetical protein
VSRDAGSSDYKDTDVGSVGKKVATQLVVAVLCFEPEIPMKTAEKANMAVTINRCRVV